MAANAGKFITAMLDGINNNKMYDMYTYLVNTNKNIIIQILLKFKMDCRLRLIALY